MLSIFGLGLVLVPLWKNRGNAQTATAPSFNNEEDLASTGLRWRRFVFTVLLLLSIVMPSDWTQDVPARYKHRHSCLSYSVMYPRIDTLPKIVPFEPDACRAPNQPFQPTSNFGGWIRIALEKRQPDVHNEEDIDFEDKEIQEEAGSGVERNIRNYELFKEE